MLEIRRVRFRLQGLVVGLVGLGAVGCVPLPVLVTPSVTGRVVDEASGKGVADAIVVVRFDARYDDLLPDRDLVGHQEVVTDAQGRFRVPRGAKAGLSAWPLVRTEARIAGVIQPDYRCPRPRGVGKSGSVEIRLTRTSAVEDRRASCRPLAARPSETPEYLAAWRGLYPRGMTRGQQVRERQLDRVLSARSVFGHGENCTGPVVDLSLAPAGDRVALRVESARQREIEVVELTETPPRMSRVPAPDDGARVRRLAWTSGSDLVLWEPATRIDDGSASGLSSSAAAPEIVWSGSAAPASPGRAGADADRRPVPIQPSDLNDEGDARWRGRSFRVTHVLDPLTGLTVDSLNTLTSEGDETSVRLPGETCGPRGQYGRPHFRIAADGETGLDLRWVEGGCHAVAIDLGNGDWQRIDGARADGVCSERRRVPLTQLQAALRGYVRELEDALESAGGDPRAAYTLRIEADGTTHIESRDYMGQLLRLEAQPFPVTTPLRRIDVSSVGKAGDGSPSPSPSRSPSQPPALEPL